jgi:hypothetical protein
VKRFVQASDKVFKLSVLERILGNV